MAGSSGLALAAPPMSIFENNRDLLDRFRRGERAALAEVYWAYVDEVAVLVRRGFIIEALGHVHVTGARDADIEELIQDTFSKAFAGPARDAYDGLRPYRPYLLRIAKNLMIDRFRARRREDVATAGGDGRGTGDIVTLLDSDVLFPMPDPEPADPAADLHFRTLASATAEFTAALDSESRQLVRLRFEEDLSQDAVARTMGCSRRRVRTLEARVQRRLRRFLRDRGLLDD